MSIIGCISKEVSVDIKNGIHEIADNGISKAAIIESRGNLSENDKRIIQLAKSHCGAMKRFANSLSVCEV